MLAKRPAAVLKRDSKIDVFCEICEFFKNTYFAKHLQIVASENTMAKERVDRFSININITNYLLKIIIWDNSISDMFW